MLLPFNKKDKKKPAEAKVTPVRQAGPPPAPPSSSVAEFLPYYCHYNPHTILTKNGELMQVIKITTNLQGLDYESGTDMSTIVREMIRSAISQHIPTDKYAIWLHTIRKRQSIRYRGKFKEAFAGTVHDRWQHIHRWKYQYYNEIYVTVLHDGQTSELLRTDNFKDLVLTKRNRVYRNAYLDKVVVNLDKTVEAMVATIRKGFNAHRLTVVERVPDQSEMPVTQALFYSEPMEFLGTLLNLRAEQFLLPQLDLSESLPTTRHTFGFNALETKTDNGKRRFGAILTLKQYREVPSETIDRLLQAPMEFIISQAFHFIPHTGALKQYREQKELFDMSGDFYCVGASGIEDMMASQSEKPTDFGEHQTSIMVLCDEFKQLDSEISKVQSAFADLGLITIREDIKLEECFWSQLPGNFEFIRRRDTINTARIGGFCRLNRYPHGLASGNHWGDAVTILPTLVASPYFFNFHNQDNGHTMVFDYNSFNDQFCSIMLNFLLCETRKFEGRLYIFDRNRAADLLFQKLGGNYHNFSVLNRDPEQKQVRLNPLMLPDSPRNRSFLAAWLGTLMPASAAPLADAQKEKLRASIDHLYSGEPDKRNFPALMEHLASLDLPLAKAFSKWHDEGIYAGIFDADTEEVDVSAALNAFDMSPVVKNKECIIPIFAYLLHRVITEIDGRPVIIVLRDAWDLIDNPFIAPRIESLMDMLQENNAMVIFTTSKTTHIAKTEIFAGVFKRCATQLILPDDVNHDYAAQGTGISEYDSKRLIRMDRQKGAFLLKQNNESIALKMDLKEMDELNAVFANDSKNLAAALGHFAKGSLSG